MRIIYPKDDKEATDNQFGITAKYYEIYNEGEYCPKGFIYYKNVKRVIVW